MKPNFLFIVGLTVTLTCVVAACGGGGSDTASTLATVAGAPTILSATAGNASTSIAFTAPASGGGSAITDYTATCTASGASRTGTAASSPVVVSGLTNGMAYRCAMVATNGKGAGAASLALTVTPLSSISTSTSSSLNAAYKTVAWQAGVTVTFPTDCTMTYTSNGVPSHAIDAYYLEPAKDVGGAVVATTPGSGMPLATAAYGASTKSMTQTFNTCPTKAAATTATSGGAIGWMISGSAMFNATEGNNTTPALTDNVSYTFTDAGSVSHTAKFIDSCNGHPTPLMNTYHYHGLPACVTALVDSTVSASHIIGIANDGFPIYGNKDINGSAVSLAQLDACNGITSATAEFPAGIYHYVLPQGVTSLRSSIGCYAGTVSPATMAAAAIANGICYGKRPTEQQASALSAFSAGNRSRSRWTGA